MRLKSDVPVGLEIGELALGCSLGFQCQLVIPLLDSRRETRGTAGIALVVIVVGVSLTFPKGDVK